MKNIIIVLTVAIFAFAAQTAFACSCVVQPPGTKTNYSKWAKEFNGTAFSGRVTKIVENRDKYAIAVTFAVDKVWRGDVGAEAVVTTAIDSAMCGVTYVEGKDYVVISNSKSGETIITSSCAELEYASHRAEYLKALGESRKPKDPAREAVKFQEFGNINCEGELAMLDGLAIQIQNDPASMAYLIIYGGSKGKRNEAKARLARMMYYWTMTRRMDPARLKGIDGGYRETLSGEIWLATANDDAPKPTPTVSAKKVKLRGAEKIRKYNCAEDMGH